MNSFAKDERVAPSIDLKSVKVLYVEDEQIIRESLAMLLRRYVPNLYLASNGEEGLEKFKELRPEIVLSDICMPRLNGLDMAKIMKEIAPDTQVIIMTAFGDSEYLLKAIEIGLSGYLIKPINKNSLFRLLNESARYALAQHAKERFNRYTQQIFDLQQNLLVVLDDNMVIQRANKSFLDYFSCSSKEEFSEKYKNITNAVALACQNNFNAEFIERVIADGQNSHSVTLCNKEESTRYFTISASKIDMEEGEYIVSFTDVTSFEKENKKLQHQAMTDTLTGIDNRLKFQEVLDEWKAHGEEFSVIFFDIDHFKQINDEFGHDKGDDILSELAKLVRSMLRDDDVFARLGGEEFVILLRHVNLDKSVEIAERIRHMVEQTKFSIDHAVTCSFGVARSSINEESALTIKRADSAMYLAKRSGRNRVEVDKD